MSRSGIVNVRMVITEEKILSNIDKIQKMINPNSKKQIVQLEEDSYFKDLIDSIKAYLIEYPKKKNFPVSVYKAAYELVETATNQFEENTQKIEELIRQREENIALAGEIKELVVAAKSKRKGWKDEVKAAEDELPEEIAEALYILGRSKSVKSESHQDSLKLLKARVSNLESNLHIEIDMERIEDRSKALSYIGIEIADALKVIPAPVEEKKQIIEEAPVVARHAKETKSTRGAARTSKATRATQPTRAAQSARTSQSVRTAQPTRASQTARATQATRTARAATPTVARHAKVAEPVRKVERAPKTVKQKVTTPILNVQEDDIEEIQAYTASTTFRRKASLWERIKESKFMRAATYIFRIRIRIELPNALPEGRGDNY